MSRFNPCNCPAGQNSAGDRHAPDCPSYSGMTASMAAMLSVTEFQRKQARKLQPNDIRSVAQRLREYSRNPHHINPASEAFQMLIDEAADLLSAIAQQEQPQ